MTNQDLSPLAVVLSSIGLVSLGWSHIAADMPVLVQFAAVPVGAAVGWALVRAAAALDGWLARRAS